MLVFGLLSPPLAARATEYQSRIMELASVPKVRPEFPTPKDPNLLFYIQTSRHSDTVVYTARLDAAGQPIQTAPVDVFWRRFTRDGVREPLSFLESHLAFGVDFGAVQGRRDAFWMDVAARPKRKMLVEVENGRPRTLMDMGSRLARLLYVYVDMEGGGLFPTIHHVDIFGRDLASGRALRERVTPVTAQP
jgi:hypothetical protein